MRACHLDWQQKEERTSVHHLVMVPTLSLVIGRGVYSIYQAEVYIKYTPLLHKPASLCHGPLSCRYFRQSDTYNFLIIIKNDVSQVTKMIQLLF